MEDCSNAHCSCHDTPGSCCTECKIPGILIITLAIGLADKTWIERDIEIEDDENLWGTMHDSKALNNEVATEAAWAKVSEDEQNSLAPSFWTVIHWEWKD